MIDAVQAAIFAAVDAATTTPVYSHVPQDDGAASPSEPSYPYVQVEAMELERNDTDTETGFIGTFNVHVWSRYRGSKEAADIQAQIYTALNNTAPTVTDWCISLIWHEFTAVETDADRITRHGIQRFGIMFEPEPLQAPTVYTLVDVGAGSLALVDVAANGDNFVVVGQDGFIAKSEDEGATWETLPQGGGVGLDPTFDCRAVGIVGDTILVGIDNYIIRSIDGGTTWAQVLNTGAASNLAVYEILTNRSGYWIVGTDSGNNWWSSDNGATWTQGAVTSLSDRLRGGCYVEGTAREFIISTTTGRIVRTTNGGVSWSALTPTGTDANTDYWDVEVIAPSIIMAWAAGRLTDPSVRSADGGLTWEPMTPEISQTVAYTKIESDQQRTVIAVEREGYARISEDQGLTWEFLPRGLNSGSTFTDWYGIATNRQNVWLAVGELGRVVRFTRS